MIHAQSRVLELKRANWWPTLIAGFAAHHLLPTLLLTVLSHFPIENPISSHGLYASCLLIRKLKHSFLLIMSGDCLSLPLFFLSIHNFLAFLTCLLLCSPPFQLSSLPTLFPCLRTLLLWTMPSLFTFWLSKGPKIWWSPPVMLLVTRTWLMPVFPCSLLGHPLVIGFANFQKDSADGIIDQMLLFPDAPWKIPDHNWSVEWSLNLRDVPAGTTGFKKLQSSLQQLGIRLGS